MIVEMGDRFPESRMNNPQTYSEMFFSELCKELLPRIGFLNTVAGNYVVVDHGNDEFSFYGHLSEGCILVSVGQKVKRGDVIAKVGNTGHSVEPHLHFQLMDSPSFLEANGLPVTFENVAATETHEDVVEANSLIYPDFLYIPVSEQNENSNG
jgi:murein DD-endopeptidase MepM/ murein hydrolase activator NlpD